LLDGQKGEWPETLSSQLAAWTRQNEMKESHERKETNMYGTIGHYRVKPGMEGQLVEQLRVFEAAKVPGTIAVYTYRMDADPNDYYIAVVFASKEAYWANAQSPEQDARYRQLLPLLEREPEWRDGEIIYALQAQATV
jgi:heme-degrading monooxygenase HmoA